MSDDWEAMIDSDSDGSNDSQDEEEMVVKTKEIVKNGPDPNNVNYLSV